MISLQQKKTEFLVILKMNNQRIFYPWNDSFSRIECIIDGPWPVYESLNWIRLLEFILFKNEDDIGTIRFKFHGRKLQAITEKNMSIKNWRNNISIYKLYIGYDILTNF